MSTRTPGYKVEIRTIISLNKLIWPPDPRLQHSIGIAGALGASRPTRKIGNLIVRLGNGAALRKIGEVAAI